MDTNDRFLSLKEVKEVTGFSRSSIYSYAKQDRFPKAVLLGARKVGWLKAEIDDWAAQKVAARDTASTPATLSNIITKPL